MKKTRTILIGGIGAVLLASSTWLLLTPTRHLMQQVANMVSFESRRHLAHQTESMVSTDPQLCKECETGVRFRGISPAQPEVPDNYYDRLLRMVCSSADVARPQACAYYDRALQDTAAGSPSPLTQIDRMLENMPLGNIAFNVPHAMNISETALIDLVLSVRKSLEDLTRMITAKGEKEGAQIRVSSRMEARLSGPNFRITAVTPEVQAITSTETTTWRWEIQPTSPGKHHLHLTLTALFSLDGAATQRTLRSFDKTIDIEVTWGQKTLASLSQHWQWLWTAILLPVGAWLWKKRKRLPAAEEENITAKAA